MTVFTEAMKKTHTILIPNMLPIHFKLVGSVLEKEGYHISFFEEGNPQLIRHEGLKCVHNDMCYPALLVIGEMMAALKSGKYDLQHTALMITQTGGGCRASNYIHLLRKALKDHGMEQIPVISLNVGGLETQPGFKLTPKMTYQAIEALYYGDLLMCLYNQCKPYEQIGGATDQVLADCIEMIAQHLSGALHKKCRYADIIHAFDGISRNTVKKVKVGIVGEIYLKYSPLGNNYLEKFLMDEGAEVVVSGMSDFMLYCCYNPIMDYKLYGMNKKAKNIAHLIYQYLYFKQKRLIKAVKKHSTFTPPSDFEHVKALASKTLSLGVKMGEGWLLTGEMIEHLTSNVHNVVCAQPFGCLPNHIVGKGMVRKLMNQYENANITVIDYDPSATEVNIENRIKLMLSNAKLKAIS
ncbi:MAG: hypothetical protein ACRDDX_09330 [Cellulosilyticaceae bacterium]